MTKDGLARAVAKSLDTSVADGHRATDAVFGSIKATLRKGESIFIRKFGALEIRNRAERPGRNPKTGEPATIKAGKKLRFRASKSLKIEVDR